MTTGGQSLLLVLSEKECVKDIHNICNPSGDPFQISENDQRVVMVDKGDGTYTYEFDSGTKERKLYLTLYESTADSVYPQYFYLSTDWSGRVYYRTNLSNILALRSDATAATGASSVQ
jgi:hypothetical protein